MRICTPKPQCTGDFLPVCLPRMNCTTVRPCYDSVGQRSVLVEASGVLSEKVCWNLMSEQEIFLIKVFSNGKLFRNLSRNECIAKSKRINHLAIWRNVRCQEKVKSLVLFPSVHMDLVSRDHSTLKVLLNINLIIPMIVSKDGAFGWTPWFHRIRSINQHPKLRRLPRIMTTLTLLSVSVGGAPHSFGQISVTEGWSRILI